MWSGWPSGFIRFKFCFLVSIIKSDEDSNTSPGIIDVTIINNSFQFIHEESSYLGNVRPSTGGRHEHTQNYTAGLACLCDMKLHSEFKYVLYINAVTALPPGCFHLGVYLNCLVSRQPSQEPARQTTVDYLKVAWRRVYQTIILPSFPYVHTSMRT